MKLTGQETFSQSRSEIWNKITDLEFLAGIIPDLERIEQVDSDRLVCRIRPKFGFLSGSMKLTFTFVEQQPPEQLKIAILAKRIAASMSVEIVMSFKETDQTSCLSWECEILKRTGLLKPIGNSLIQGAAEKVIASTWSDFRQALAAENEQA